MGVASKTFLKLFFSYPNVCSLMERLVEIIRNTYTHHFCGLPAAQIDFCLLVINRGLTEVQHLQHQHPSPGWWR